MPQWFNWNVLLRFSSEEERRKTTLYVFTLLGLGGILLTNIADLIQEIPSSIGANALTVVALFLVLYFLKKAWYDLSAFLFVFSLSALVFYDVILLGVRLGSYLYFVSLMVTVPFIIKPGKLIQFHALAAIPIVLLLISLNEPISPIRPLSQVAYWEGTKTNLLVFTIMMYAFIYSTIFLYQKLTIQLAESATSLNTLLQQTELVIWSIDDDYQLLRANQNFFHIYQAYTGHEIALGDNILDDLSENEQLFWREKYQEGFSGKRQSFIANFHIDQRKPTIYEVSLNPVLTEANTVLSIVIYANDITERVMVNSELEQQRETLSETLELAKVGVWVSDRKLKIISWDAQTAAIMGLPPEDVSLPEVAYFNRIHPYDYERVVSEMQKFEAGANELMLEHRIITPAGEVRHLLEKAKAERTEGGDLLMVRGFTQDITELRREEKLNEQTAHLLREVKIAIEELLAFEKVDQAVIEAVRRIAKAVGAKFAWIFEHGLFEEKPGARVVTPQLLSETLDSEVLQLLKSGASYDRMGVAHWYQELFKGNVLEGNAEAEVQSSFLKACNLKRYVILPIFVQNQFWGFIGFDNLDLYRLWTTNDENLLRGFCNALGSVISLNQYQQNLKAAKDLAERATQSKSNFLSNISHEIRTPMNAIIGLTELLLPEEEHPERLEYLQAIKFSADNLLRLINDLLDLSKIEADKLVLDNQVFDVRSLIRKFEKLMHYLVKEKGLELEISIEEGVPKELKGDVVRFNQVLLNLGSNAIKFTEKGKVRIALKLLEAEDNRCWIQLMVSDTGIGIAENKLQLIFDNFAQADKYISKKFGGTGLGLTITQKLVELMGGRIQVSSILGEGSDFEVILPFEPLADTYQTPEAETSTKQGKLLGYKLLIVEDNRINIMLIKRLLKLWEAEFEVAEHGGVALEKLRENQYDLLLLDLQMPVMNGFELLAAIRSGEAGARYKTIPVIALTADAYEQTREKAIEAGFSDFITKPIQAEELLKKIIALLH